MDLKNFATRESPLRASKLPTLLRCSLSGILELLEEDRSGRAADTGSAVHYAAKVFHNSKVDRDTALAVMRDQRELYPLADLDDARLSFSPYAEDERNRNAEIVLCEEKIEVSIPPAENDPTQAEIVIRGTLDQVRKEENGLVVCDIKTGKALLGAEMLQAHCAQLCAYQIGASKKLGQRINRACVIRTYDYRQRTRGPVFWYAAWTYADAELMLREIARVVADVRSGRLAVCPSADACRWCPGVSPANCLSMRKEVLAR